jgi:FkbM family methyltransferase
MSSLQNTPDGFYDTLGIAGLYHGGFNLDWFAEFGVEPKVIFDVGSYDGGDAIRFKRRFPEASVIAFEGDPHRYRETRDNCLRAKVEAIEAAVTDHNGQTNWYVAHDYRPDVGGAIGSQGSIYLQNEILNRKFDFVKQTTIPITVRSMTLTSFCAERQITRIDLLHMDVQGAEASVLGGLGALRPALIYLEVPYADGAGWVGAPSKETLELTLSQMGYALKGDFDSDRLYAIAGLQHKRIPRWRHFLNRLV